MAGTGVPYFPQTLGPNVVVGRLAPNPGPTEQIPFAQLSAALGIGGSNYLLASNIAGTNTITGTVATAPALAANQVVFLIPANTNTGAVTFDRDAQGTPKSVFYNGSALVGGEIAAGVPSVWFYDGTQYNIIANGIAAGNAAARGTVASATTTNLDTSSSLTQQITGTTTITGFTLANGHVRIVEFSGILTLTNGASLILPGGANITTAAGDTAIFVGEPSGVVRCVIYVRAALPPSSPAIGVVQKFLTSGTYTPTVGMRFCRVTVVAGGGGGGGAPATGAAQVSVGSGGAGGGTAIKTVSAATVGASQTVTIGAGGAANSGATGGAGGTSSFGAICSATGGAGGIASVAGTNASSNGVTGGIGSSGDINIIGGSSAPGVGFNASNTVISGSGGTSYFGGGAPGVVNTSGVSASANSGGGGSGAGETASAGALSGGSGGSGIVVVEEFF